MIPALIPPQAPLQELIHGPLPTPPPPAILAADRDVAYGMSTVGDGGRVNDRHVLKQLDWAPHTRLEIRLANGLLLVRPYPQGSARVNADGYFRIPFRLRRRVGLLIGDRVLIVGRRSVQQLAVHPPGALDELFHSTFALLAQ
ncbi:hypothetical protein [Nocardia sp. XZ_19_385]|uniref:hypothetical protein n=1 Tax=Nocardia sp. XZ_19_385 TaxID=2769488 RepID=UPI00188F47C9|nr:hypothetical protein [Nocardia sp. XZ_19_385]